MKKRSINDKLLTLVHFVMTICVGFTVMALCRNGLQILLVDNGLGDNLIARLACFALSFLAAFMIMRSMFKSWYDATVLQDAEETGQL